MKRIGITGGRNYPDRAKVRHVLDLAYKVLNNDLFLVVGDARGADAHAREWAKDTLTPDRYAFYKADWDKLGKSAGHIRNKAMLDSGLDMLIAFPGGIGTANMKEQVRKHNQDLGAFPIKIMEVK